MTNINKKIKADLHNHLRTSSILEDSDFNNSIDFASKKLGSGACFGLINMHDRRYEKFSALKGYEREWIGENKNAVYIPEKDVLIVRGQEVTTKQGHLLVLGLGYDVHLKNGVSLEETLKKAKDNNGIIIIDHPFYMEGTGNYLEKNSKLLENIDAIEIHNGEASFGLPLGLFPIGANKKAQKFYSKIKNDYPHLGAIASSDGHSIEEIGSSWTEIDKPEYNKNFVCSLKSSIINTNLEICKEMKNSSFSAVKHLKELAGIIASEKLGSKRFETERPDEMGLSI
ncbi:MAG: PHP-associated domain-containing protein [Nanoarchaeota archaeon]